MDIQHADEIGRFVSECLDSFCVFFALANALEDRVVSRGTILRRSTYQMSSAVDHLVRAFRKRPCSAPWQRDSCEVVPCRSQDVLLPFGAIRVFSAPLNEEE